MTTPGADTAFRKYEQAGAYHHALMEHDSFYIAKIEKALSLVRAGAIVLDVGCGDGVFIKQARQRARTVVGLDPSLEGVRLAREASGVATVFAASAYEMPVRNASVDLVVMIDVVNYLSRCEEAVAEAARVLRPGGCLAVMSPCDVSLESERASIPDSWQVRAWTIEQVTDFVARHLRVADVTFIEKAVPPAALGLVARAASAIGVAGVARRAVAVMRRRPSAAQSAPTGRSSPNGNIVLNALSLPPSLIKAHEKLEFVVVAVREDTGR